MPNSEQNKNVAKLYQKPTTVEIRITSEDGDPHLVWVGTARQLYLYVDGHPDPRVIDVRVYPAEKK